MQYAGVLVGMYTFIMIGVLHVPVERIERVIDSQVWPWFVVLGILFGLASLMVVDVLSSALLGVSGFLFAWSGPELRKQRERVSGAH